ncbi:hypothetical protein SLA2020_479330 [Shorea laevis]
MAEELKLFKKWSSPYGLRIVWALKLKGIQFDPVDEDLSNKSSLPLQYNPVHKKIPVLVHNGKPISRSKQEEHAFWPNFVMIRLCRQCGMLSSIKMIDEERFPSLSAWIQAFSDTPEIKESWPSRDKLVAKFRALSEKFVAATSK